MNSPTGNAANASNKARRRKNLLTLSVARLMLPLVQRIVTDIVEIGRRLAELNPQLADLDRRRRTLDWSGRMLRYSLRDQVQAAELQLQNAKGELDNLGLMLNDNDRGMVDFPTEVDRRQACFSWQPGEDTIRFWHYDGESHRRRVPAHWATEDRISAEADEG